MKCLQPLREWRVRQVRVWAWLIAVSFVLMARLGCAEQIEFQLTGPNSLLANAYIVGLGNLPMNAQDQAGTSLTTTYSGTITVNVDNVMNPTSISFVSANAVAANSGSWLPEIGGGNLGDVNTFGDADPGAAMLANYGFVLDTDLGAGRTVFYIASRDTVISLDTVTAGTLPITAGQFDPLGIGISIPQGTYDANLSEPGIFGGDAVTSSDPLVDERIAPNCTDRAGTANRCTAMGSYMVSGNMVTLTVPIDFLLGGGTPEINFTGTFTATYSLETPLLGDYNDNGTVDAADYAVWRDNVGTTILLPNDNLGGMIGQAHYTQWRANFGSSAGSGIGSGGAVPEPSCAVLLIAGLSTASICRKYFFRRQLWHSI